MQSFLIFAFSTALAAGPGSESGSALPWYRGALVVSMAYGGEQGASERASVEEAPVPVPEPSEQALRYYWSGNILWVVGQVWGVLVPAAFLFTGFSARIRDWAQRIGRKWVFVVGVYFILFMAINVVLELPLSFYVGYIRQHAYGLSNQSLSKWWMDFIKGFLVVALQGALFLWVPYLILRKSPRRWWLYTSLLVVPFICFQLLIAPVLIDPLFNEFSPMKNQELETDILSLAEQAGIEGSRVFEVDKSVDTKTVNAYVTGFFGTKRIVLWDTTLAKLEPEEILFIVGHEMGHYVLGHIFSTILVVSVVLGVALYCIYRVSGALIERYQTRFGFTVLSDVASLPLLLLLMHVLSLALIPLVLGYSRYHEREADRFGLELTRSNRAAAIAFVKLQEENLGVPRPGPLVRIWRSSHPSLAERIEFCNTYRPWLKGEPSRYGRYFRDHKDHKDLNDIKVVHPVRERG
ncbi:MAG: M48 family metallopeptidase [Candidatus Hydrogenedentes bacterium]|nr:M48 family metallopeptidase [Candidatus Hydrogenedentota bacterium]